MAIGYQKEKYIAEQRILAAQGDKDAIKYLAQLDEAVAAGATPEPTEAEVPVVSPKRESVTPTMAEAMTMLAGILQEMRSAQTQDSRQSFMAQAEILEKILTKTRPENQDPPLISAFSNPTGERDDPKPALKCKMRWAGYELKTDTLTPQEITLLNRLEPTDTFVTKANGTKIAFTITAKRDSLLRIEELDISFPCTRDQRYDHAPMVSYLREALGERIPSVQELMAELDRLRALVPVGA